MDNIIEQFDKLGGDASCHFADDTGREWGKGYAKQREAMALFWAHPELQEQMREKARRFLWSLKMEEESAARRKGEKS